MAGIELSQMELVEVSDAISEVLGRIIAAGDPDKHETKYGTLTLLHQAQAKITPIALGFKIEETAWCQERLNEIKAIRRKQRLPVEPTAAEYSRWQSGVTPR